MRRQRPVPARIAGAVVCLALLVSSGCGTADAVRIRSPELSDQERTACRELLKRLPGTVSGQSRRKVDPADAMGAAWGDPAIVLRCGVSTPSGFDRFAACHVANGVGWYVPERQVEDQGADVVMTTVGFAQNVEVRLPARYRPPAAAMVDLAEAVKRSLKEIEPCA